MPPGPGLASVLTDGWLTAGCWLRGGEAKHLLSHRKGVAQRSSKPGGGGVGRPGWLSSNPREGSGFSLCQCSVSSTPPSLLPSFSLLTPPLPACPDSWLSELPHQGEGPICKWEQNVGGGDMRIWEASRSDRKETMPSHQPPSQK